MEQNYFRHENILSQFPAPKPIMDAFSKFNMKDPFDDVTLFPPTVSQVMPTLLKREYFFISIESKMHCLTSINFPSVESSSSCREDIENFCTFY